MKIFRKYRSIIVAVGLAISLFVALDFAAGIVRDRLMKSSSCPQKVDYLVRKADEDIIIIGNSAGEYHLLPQILTDSTGMTAFNLSEAGGGLKFTVAQAEILLARHKPKILVVALNPRNFRDYKPKSGFEMMYPLYGRGLQDADSILNATLPVRRLLFKSNLWLLNSDLMPRLAGTLGFGKPIYLETKGFRSHPFRGRHPGKRFEEPIRNVPAEAQADFDRLKELAVRSKVTLILLFPPNHIFGNQWSQSPFMKRAAADGSVIIWDDTDHPAFKNDSTNFFDLNHLTDEAAARYSDTVASRLRRLDLSDAISGGKIR